MRLPQIRYNVQKNQSEIVQMRGINFSDALQDGDLADSRNISARRFPYITTRRKRVKQTTYSNATALTAWDKLVVVQGTNLLYDGASVGTVTAGAKQFAVVNTKLVIWPDKKYLDLSTLQVKSLGASASGAKATFTTNTITVTWNVNFTTLFQVGDCIEISGCTTLTANNKSIVIQKVEAKKLTFTDDSFTAGTDNGTIHFDRKIPDLDYICESENRLWGCSNADRTIYASALGDPTNFFTYEGISTDSYALAVGSEGNFTGCCKLSSSVLFFKESVLHKMLGSNPAEYALYTYTLDGLRAGCNKSLQVINETLFYMGLHGVYAFTGGTPTLISSNFGNKDFTDAVAGNDGDTYYLSVKDGDKYHLFCYETRYGIWVQEDDSRVVDFGKISKDLYFLDSNGDVWIADGGVEDPDIEWSAQFTPFYETVQGRKIYSKLLIRMQIAKGSYVSAQTRHDGGVWAECGKIYGSFENVSVMRIGVNRCDKFELRLSGKGPCTILSILRQFAIGSDS